MLLESIILIATICIIAILFYKQTNPEYKINQVEKGDFSKVLELLPELSPIVVRGFQVPNFWTQNDISANPRLQAIPLVYPGFQPFSLGSATQMELPTRPSTTAQLIAQESGIQVWSEHTILPKYEPLWFGSTLTIQTSAIIGNQGLQQTTAYSTILMPTEQPIKVSLIHKKHYDFCPTVWRYTMPSTWSKANTPLVGEIQFIDIIIRPGTLLLLPPHWRFSYISHETHKKPMVALLEIQNPLSKIATALTKN